MKLKLLGAFTLALISINSFAYIASPGVKEENIRTNCTDPTKCGFIERDDLAKKELKKLWILKKNNIASNPLMATRDTLTTHSFVPNAYGYVNEATKISGAHNVAIENDSKNIERFVVRYELYSGDDDIYYENNITLNPGDYYSNYFESFENIFRDRAGIYTTVALTSINGDGISLDLYSGELDIENRR